MTEAIVVLNAGSSSLKFSIYALQAGALTPLARGKADSVDDAPRFTAASCRGEILADTQLGRGRAGYRGAFDHLARWARHKFGGEFAAAAVGHRFVHGGAEFIGATRLVERLSPAGRSPTVWVLPSHEERVIAAATRAILDGCEPPVCTSTSEHWTKVQLE